MSSSIKPSSSGWITKGVTGLLLGLGLAGGLASAANPDRAQEPQAPTVTVAHPQVREIIEWDEFTGRFEAVERVELRARVSGYLESVHFEEGQIVDKGDLLFVIDPRPYEAAAARAEAELTQAHSQLKLADLDLQRGERLLKQNAISQQEVDTRRATHQEARANVAAAEAALRTARLELGYTRITAPVSGRISSRRVHVGNLIAAGEQGQALTSIVSLDPLHFVFDVSEAEYLRYVRLRGGQGRLTGDPGLPAGLRLLDEKAWTHEGYIDFIDNSLDQNTGTLRMRAVFSNPDGLLRPGIFGRLRLPATDPQQALLIPDAAVMADQSAKMVMTVAGDGTVRPQPVELGPLHGDMRIVRSGLSASDQVIVEGLLRARPGSKVTPQLQPETAEKVAAH